MRRKRERVAGKLRRRDIGAEIRVFLISGAFLTGHVVRWPRVWPRSRWVTFAVEPTEGAGKIATFSVERKSIVGIMRVPKVRDGRDDVEGHSHDHA